MTMIKSFGVETSKKKKQFFNHRKKNNLKQKLSTFRFCDKSIFICSCAVRNCGLFWAVLFCFSTLKADRHQWKWKQIVYNMYLSYTSSPSFWTYKSNFSVGRSSVGYLRAHCLWMQMLRVCTISGQKKWKVKTCAPLTVCLFLLQLKLCNELAQKNETNLNKLKILALMCAHDLM